MKNKISNKQLNFNNKEEVLYSNNDFTYYQIGIGKQGEKIEDPYYRCNEDLQYYSNIDEFII